MEMLAYAELSLLPTLTKSLGRYLGGSSRLSESLLGTLLTVEVKRRGWSSDSVARLPWAWEVVLTRIAGFGRTLGHTGEGKERKEVL